MKIKDMLLEHPGVPIILIFLIMLSGAVFQYYIPAIYMAGFICFVMGYGIWLMENNKDE